MVLINEEGTMKQKPLGKSELRLSVIGLGTWAIGGLWQYGWGRQDDTQSIKTIRRAVELGINWIDTAPVYGLGHAETIVGKAIKDLSEPPIIATKCGLIWNDKGRVIPNLSRESIIREVEDSLRRLGKETIDLYQIHWPNPKEQIGEGWDTIGRLIQDGKVRYGGVSNFSVKQMKHIQSKHPIASLQPPYSMFVRHTEESLPYCQKSGIGVIPYSPMQKGLLTGKITKSRMVNLPENDHRKNDPMFNESELSVNLDFVNQLQKIADEAGRSVAQLAIAWTLYRSEVSSVIVGGRRPEQIDEVAGAVDFELSEVDYANIESLLAERKEKLKSL